MRSGCMDIVMINIHFFIATDFTLSISDSSLAENSRVHGRLLAADQRRLHKQQLLSLFVKLLRLVIYPWKCPNARHICPQILLFWESGGRSQEWAVFCFFVWHLKSCTMRLVLGLAAVIIWLFDGGGRDQWRSGTAVEVFHKPNLSGCLCSTVLRNHRHTHTHNLSRCRLRDAPRLCRCAHMPLTCFFFPFLHS